MQELAGLQRKLGASLLLLLLGVVPLLGGEGAAASDAALEPELVNLLPAPPQAPERLRIVSFNVHYARDLAALVETFSQHPELKAADIFLLQEVESYPAEGASRTRKLAEALRLNYVYGPARHTAEGGTHGLAILSRFPLGDVRVIPLPRNNLIRKTRRRIALAATADVAGRPLRLYNVHLDTRINTRARLEQLRPVLAAAREQPVAEVVVGGDFNTNPLYWLLPILPVFRSNQAKAVDEFMKENGFAAPFREAGTTSNKALAKFRLDSIYTRGLRVGAFAVAREVKVSDHFPLWVEVGWPPEEHAQHEP